MAHSLDLTVVAEGVETEVQRVFLERHGCDLYQGHLLSPPLPPSQMEQYLRQRHATPSAAARAAQDDARARHLRPRAPSSSHFHFKTDSETRSQALSGARPDAASDCSCGIRPSLNLCALLCLSIAMTVSVRASQGTAPASSEPLLRTDASGEEIYRQACAACHSIDGSGQPQSVVGFELPLPNGHGFPDFTDCATNTVEPLARLDGGRPSRRPGSRARSPHAGVRRRAVRRADRAGRQVPLDVLQRPVVAARRPELSARVLHREGVSRERNRLDDRRDRLRRKGGDQRAASTSIASARAASTK